MGLNAALVQPGITGEVKYDLHKPQPPQLLTLHVQQVGSTRVAACREELNQLRDERLITDEGFRGKREEILKGL